MSDKTRTEFEAMFGAPPYEEDLRRYPDDDGQSWPGQYRSIDVQRAWEAWLASRKTALVEGADYVLDLLVAAGHITREKAFQTRDIARNAGVLPEPEVAAAEARQGGETS